MIKTWHYKYNPLFWMDFYWNRFLCLFSFHIWVYLPEEFCDVDDVPGEIICVCCSKKPIY